MEDLQIVEPIKFLGLYLQDLEALKNCGLLMLFDRCGSGNEWFFWTWLKHVAGFWMIERDFLLNKNETHRDG